MKTSKKSHNHSPSSKGKSAVHLHDTLTGLVLSSNQGYGFVALDTGGDDVYLNRHQMAYLVHGDQVQIKIIKVDNKGRAEGQVVKLIKRSTKAILGRYTLDAGGSFVAPDDARLHRPIKIEPGSLTATSGQWIVTRLLNADPSTNKNNDQTNRLPRATIIKVIDDPNLSNHHVNKILYQHDIPHEWPDEALQQAQQLPNEVNAKQYPHHRDLRHLPFVTIDGEDAKDFDDAVYTDPQDKGGWRLYVAIADVSHYIPPHSALDNEAFNRGTSVYLPQSVIPMLPEALSNGLCSLKPQVDRLVLVADIQLDAKGNLKHYAFYQAIIHSHARLTYTQVDKIITTEEADSSLSSIPNFNAVLYLQNLYDVYKALLKQRIQRGALEFDSVVARIILNSQQQVVDILPTERNDAHRLIEECMLCANVCAADFLLQQTYSSLYRVHPSPTGEKLAQLTSYLNEFKLRLQDPKSPKAYQAIIKDSITRSDSEVIKTMILRSLGQAYYTPSNGGHFGLAYAAYTHFTSPIRRYPDLLVHRAIKRALQTNPDSEESTQMYPYDLATMLAYGEHTSMAERRANIAVWDMEAMLKCQYMTKNVGNQYQGHIQSVTKFGLFVMLDNLFIEGLIHISNLPHDFYQYQPDKHCLVGKRYGGSFKIGDKVTVKVASVNEAETKIDLDLINHHG